MNIFLIQDVFVVFIYIKSKLLSNHSSMSEQLH